MKAERLARNSYKKLCSKCRDVHYGNMDEIYALFGANMGNPDNLSHVCKKCSRERDSLPHRGSKRVRYKHPQKYKARSILNNALASGKIKKSPCVICQDPKSERITKNRWM